MFPHIKTFEDTVLFSILFSTTQSPCYENSSILPLNFFTGCLPVSYTEVCQQLTYSRKTMPWFLPELSISVLYFFPTSGHKCSVSFSIPFSASPSLITHFQCQKSLQTSPQTLLVQEQNRITLFTQRQMSISTYLKRSIFQFMYTKLIPGK